MAGVLSLTKPEIGVSSQSNGPVHRRRPLLTLGTHTSSLETIITDLLAITMVCKMMLHSIAQFLVFFVVVTDAEARRGSFQPPARSLEVPPRHFTRPDLPGMPANRKLVCNTQYVTPVPNKALTFPSIRLFSCIFSERFCGEHSCFPPF
jgi:hypothetical protein